MIKINAIRTSYFGEMSLGIWESDLFRAHAYQDKDVIRLDVERKDGDDGITWDQLQDIKNGCGFFGCDAAEFYPSQDSVINTGNWRHLYIFKNKLPLIRRSNG